jgi:lipopolysaccharide export system protein LptA
MNRRAAFLLSLGLLASPALSQTASSPAPAARVEITADQSLEWRQEDRAYLARGNATAMRGEVTIIADEMRAYYRDSAGSNANAGPIGQSDIYKLVAQGDVRIRSTDNQVFGATMNYDVDRRIATLSGGGLRLETKQDVVTADESLEYWEADKRAVARGDAIVRRAEGDAMRADLLTAQLKEDANGELVVDRVEATGNVTITTKQDVIRGSQGVYDVTSGKALVVGNVEISRGGNQLNGQRAEVDLNSGISRLIGSGGPVRGLLNEQDAPRRATPSAPPAENGAQR